MRVHGLLLPRLLGWLLAVAWDVSIVRRFVPTCDDGAITGDNLWTARPRRAHDQPILTATRHGDLMTREVPYLGGEKESLHASLDRHRDAVLWELEGLDDEQLRRGLVPSGTNLLGLVKHLASIEFGWFCETFGRPSEWIPWDPEDGDADARIRPDETTDDILAFYARARSAADRVIKELTLEDQHPTVPGLGSGEAVSLRWILIHVLEDTVRHLGHMDILRELIDGRTGSHLRT